MLDIRQAWRGQKPPQRFERGGICPSSELLADWLFELEARLYSVEKYLAAPDDPRFDNLAKRVRDLEDRMPPTDARGRWDTER